MFDRVYNYHNEVEKKLEEAYKYTGLSPKEVENFIENPDNFPPQGYEIVAKQKEELVDKVEEWATHRPTDKKKKMKKKLKSDKSRKGKTLGARKKWLQM
jgi:DNA-binding transcriptional MerR regulator